MSKAKLMEWNSKMIPSEKGFKEFAVYMLCFSVICLPVMYLHNPPWDASVFSQMIQLSSVLFASMCATAGMAMHSVGYKKSWNYIIIGFALAAIYMSIFTWIKIYR